MCQWPLHVGDLRFTMDFDVYNCLYFCRRNFYRVLFTANHFKTIALRNFIYLLIGIFFGVILIKSEVSSWYRIQEMFRFQSFHMYGIIGSAIMVALVGKLALKKSKIKSSTGNEIVTTPKKYHHGLIIGGVLFGMGWGLTGLCPGPLYALIGKGLYPIIILFISALAGTWVYSFFREKLPH